MMSRYLILNVTHCQVYHAPFRWGGHAGCDQIYCHFKEDIKSIYIADQKQVEFNLADSSLKIILLHQFSVPWSWYRSKSNIRGILGTKVSIGTTYQKLQAKPHFLIFSKTVVASSLGICPKASFGTKIEYFKNPSSVLRS